MSQRVVKSQSQRASSLKYTYLRHRDQAPATMQVYYGHIKLRCEYIIGATFISHAELYDRHHANGSFDIDFRSRRGRSRSQMNYLIFWKCATGCPGEVQLRSSKAPEFQGQRGGNMRLKCHILRLDNVRYDGKPTKRFIILELLELCFSRTHIACWLGSFY